MEYKSNLFLDGSNPMKNKDSDALSRQFSNRSPKSSPMRSRPIATEDSQAELAKAVINSPPRPPPRLRSNKGLLHDTNNSGAEEKSPKGNATKYSTLSTDAADAFDGSNGDIEQQTSRKKSKGKTSQRINKEAPTRNALNMDGNDSPQRNNDSPSKLSKLEKLVTTENNIQYGLWAHNMSYGAASLTLFSGLFACIWTNATTYECEIDGKSISPLYLFDSSAPAGNCNAVFQAPTGVDKYICCGEQFAGFDPLINGNIPLGVLYLLYSVFLVWYESVDYGYGLWFPRDTFCYNYKISPIGILDIVIGIAGLSNYATFLAGACLVTTGIVYQYAVIRREGGDGGREAKKQKAAAMMLKRSKEGNNGKDKNEDPTFFEYVSQTVSCCLNFNICGFFRRVYAEDKLSSYVWVFIFILINALIFIYTLFVWYDIVDEQQQDLLDGTMKIDCTDLICHVNRKIVRYGPISGAAPWAKACGGCLNLDCALILLPVTRMLLAKLNNSGVSFSRARAQQGRGFCASCETFASQFLAHPLTRYVPLSKNIEFHIMCAISIFIFSWGHMFFHAVNLTYSAQATLRVFRFGGWDGTDFLTGAIIVFCMFMIYSSATESIRRTKYEIFWNNHNIFFTIFFFVLFLHGPVFFYWAAIPVLLYIFERYLQQYRGSRPFMVEKVEWIPPVMAVYFRPEFKEDFKFTEGQYLYLNCPYISANEWHPFTISSAVDDLSNGPRVCLETGEEVYEVPRPHGLSPQAKWRRYLPVSQDWEKVNPDLYLEKSDTGYLDYVSVHIKVIGLDEPFARSWTRKLKEYFELMSRQKQFPFYFSRRDERGDVTIGRHQGPNGQPILRVDGPHSAPAEHYCNYGTVMLVGAGIGLTPCASILASLTKYRWKKNFNPDLLHFYWVVRQDELPSFQWLVHLLTEISFDVKHGKSSKQIERRNYLEINIYVTGVSKTPKEVPPLYRTQRKLGRDGIMPNFTAEELYAKMTNPTVESKGQIEKMKAAGTGNEGKESKGGKHSANLMEKTKHSGGAPNRLQDIWIWNGRPQWDEIFAHQRDQAQYPDIGVCFCGSPAIGADLASMCQKYSSLERECLFSLHKENF